MTKPATGVGSDPDTHLTQREREILKLLSEGLSDRAVAERLTLAVSSVKRYTHQVYAKLRASGRREAVFQARALGLLPALHPPAPPPRHNLPIQLTSFIGREKELKNLGQLLQKNETRLVTLTGSGGTGKTRLALEIASGLLEAFPDGVWLVQLASLSDPALVPQQIATTLGLVAQPGRTPSQLLLDFTRTRRLLLVLDNCEHLVEACAKLAHSLLQNTSHLKILATSREVLSVAGEISCQVPPLEMPDRNTSPTLTELGQFEAVRLFVERARLVSVNFSLDGDNAPAVAEITRRLDGIPLALELAAARLRILSPQQIAQRINASFSLLGSANRNAPPRHQTLDAMILWSYYLLSEQERELLRGLTLFTGGCTLQAAEEVCGGEHIHPQEVLDLLARLVDKSLVQVRQEACQEMRYYLLETTRQFVATRLMETGQVGLLRERFLRCYLRLAESLEPKLRSQEQIASLDRLGRELDNLRLALEWALQTDCEAGLRLASSLMWYWHIRCCWAEGTAWLERLLQAAAALPDKPALATAVRAKALRVLGAIHPVPAQKRIALEEALKLYRVDLRSDLAGLGWTLFWMSLQVSPGAVLPLAREALNLFNKCGDLSGKAHALLTLGDREQDPLRRDHYFREMLAVCQANGDTEGIASAYFKLGLTEFCLGNYLDSRGDLETGLDHFRRVNNPQSVAMVVLFLGVASFYSGELQFAGECIADSFDYSQKINNQFHRMNCLYCLCRLALAQGEEDQAAEWNEQAARSAQNLGAPSYMLHYYYHRARLARLQGDFAAARKWLEESLKTAQEDVFEFLLIFQELGYLALQAGQLEEARQHSRASLEVFSRQWTTSYYGNPLDILLALALQEGRLEHAARLAGTRLWRGIARTLSPVECAQREAGFAVVQASLGMQRFVQLQAEGQALSFSQTLDLARLEN